MPRTPARKRTGTAPIGPAVLRPALAGEPAAAGRRRLIDDHDAAEWLFYSVKGEFPAPPRLPDDPEAAERRRQALAEIEARKPQNVTASKDADGNVILTLDDGTTAKLPATK